MSTSLPAHDQSENSMSHGSHNLANLGIAKIQFGVLPFEILQGIQFHLFLTCRQAKGWKGKADASREME
jgi:hypothetical protein